MTRLKRIIGVFSITAILLFCLSAKAQQTAGAYAVLNGIVVSEVVVTNGGSGYASVPSVSFVGGGGSGAAAVATVANGMVTAITVTSGGFFYTSPPQVIIEAPSSTPFGSSLVLDLPIEGSVQDVSTNHFTVITNNGFSFATNRFGQAVSAAVFNGINQNVYLPNNASLYPTEMTLSLWLNPQQLFGTIFCGGGTDSTDGWRGYFLGFNGSEVGYQDYTGTGYNAVLSLPLTNFITGKWCHVVVTRSTNACAAFVNGLRVATQTNLTPYAKPLATPMSLAANDLAGGGFFYHGQVTLDNVHIYNRPLSDAEVQTLFAGESVLTTPPVIISQPTNQTVASGNDAVFTATVNVAPNLSYQWWGVGGAISNATNATLTLTDVQVINSGDYHLVVTNIFGSANSSNATLTVTNQSPFLTLQPQSANVSVGASVTLAVAATGSKPLSYQWRAGTTNIAEATNSTLTLTNFQPANEGSYNVVVTNLYGSATSSNATLTLPDRPPFSSSLVLDLPIEGSVVDTGTNHFTVVTNNGGIFITNRFGQPASAFSLNGMNQNLSLPYNTNLYPDEMTLSLWVNFQQFVNGALWRSGNSTADPWRGFVLLTESNLGYQDYNGSGYNASLSMPLNSFMNERWYQIVITRATNSAAMFLNGIKMSSQTNLTPYAKAQVTPMAVGANNLDGGGFFYYYPMALDNVHIYNRPLSDTEVQTLFYTELFSTNQMPVIHIQPQSQIVASGNNATLSVIASGSPDLKYQWWFGTTNLAAATNSTLIVSNFQLTNGGSYYVVVTNLHGSATSSNAVLTATNQAPFITAQPQNANALVGANAMFTVSADGSKPLSYRWRFNGTNIANATNSALTLSNVNASHIGNYSVQVTNIAGSTLSSNASLTVTFPTPTLRALNTNTMAGAPVSVPITFTANGIENTMGFSVNFSNFPPPLRLSYAGVTWGSGFAGANLLVNTNLIGAGRVGFGITFPPGMTFAAGTQEVVRIHFNSIPSTSPQGINVPIAFGDQPVLRELYNSQLQSLTVTYTSGSVNLSQTIFESDVFPRPNGNQNVTTTDLAQMGRFVARLDTTAGTEFQRVDCAPLATFGDGQKKVTDLVQAGRYVAGLDPLAAIGGPVSEVAPIPAGTSVNRLLRTTGTNIFQGENADVSVILDAQGNENAVGFTLLFNPTAVTYGGLNLGSGAVGASLFVNSSQEALGRLGVVLALATGNNFSAGLKELVRASFVASSNFAESFPVGLTDDVVTRCISDALANELPVGYMAGTVIINPLEDLELTISLAGNGVVLSWPLWAADYSLQMLESSNAWQGTWTNLTPSLVTNSSTVSATLPVVLESKYFRLFHP